ncbi:putative ORF8 [Jingmen Miniopterus schreibersii alphacoronavirus 1]|nr:putative ORF8 [Jingmen Miniopterus schreibersii alphacoronavirus 1]
MLTELDIECAVIFVWLFGAIGYIVIYQWWWSWITSGVLPEDTWFVWLLLIGFVGPFAIDAYYPGFIDWWEIKVQDIHDNILTWLLSDMRPLGFLKWILVLLGLVLYTTVVQ